MRVIIAPGLKKRVNAFSYIESSNKEGEAAGASSNTRIVVEKVRLDHQLVGRQLASDKFLSCKLCDGDIAVDGVSPCTQRAVGSVHGSHCRRSHSTTPIAPVPDSRSCE